MKNIKKILLIVLVLLETLSATQCNAFNPFRSQYHSLLALVRPVKNQVGSFVGSCWSLFTTRFSPFINLTRLETMENDIKGKITTEYEQVSIKLEETQRQEIDLLIKTTQESKITLENIMKAVVVATKQLSNLETLQKKNHRTITDKSETLQKALAAFKEAVTTDFVSISDSINERKQAYATLTKKLQAIECQAAETSKELDKQGKALETITNNHQEIDRLIHNNNAHLKAIDAEREDIAQNIALLQKITLENNHELIVRRLADKSPFAASLLPAFALARQMRKPETK